MSFEFAVAKSAGFCWGVRRAVFGAENLRKKVGENIYVLGELVHNRDQVNDLEKQGIFITRTIENAHGKHLLITAHGKDPKEIERAQKTAKRVVDMTCPIVKRQHENALALQNSGKKIILIGIKHRYHPEVDGTLSTLNRNAVLIEDEADVAMVPYQTEDRIGVIAQTTFNREKLLKILSRIKERFPNTEFRDTLCDDIELKQEELRSEGLRFDGIIVIGDELSANSRHLFEIARDELKKPSFFIPNASRLFLTDIKSLKRIFITAGASTPSSVIIGVISFLEKHGGTCLNEFSENEFIPY